MMASADSRGMPSISIAGLMVEFIGSGDQARIRFNVLGGPAQLGPVATEFSGPEEPLVSVPGGTWGLVCLNRARDGLVPAPSVTSNLTLPRFNAS
ncbi:hypothetical protein FALBO_15773 [Fusarium albosuccineum]|uniref:Uncharacterized protein n=1 Tax=Fusarium albosuccineum TaxID=1237068 RepID=A0A8H4KR36_9HYPO|nr:hypothetical protein FALBO_15773 [Fusarium albosuccineum]